MDQGKKQRAAKEWKNDKHKQRAVLPTLANNIDLQSSENKDKIQTRRKQIGGRGHEKGPK